MCDVKTYGGEVYAVELIVAHEDGSVKDKDSFHRLFPGEIKMPSTGFYFVEGISA
jgi:hypothetical protein